MHVKRAPYQKWDIGPTERFRTSIFVWFALRKHAKPDEINEIACPKATLIFTERRLLPAVTTRLLLAVVDTIDITGTHRKSSRDETSEREPFYDDIAHLLQNTKQENLLRLAN